MSDTEELTIPAPGEEPQARAGRPWTRQEVATCVAIFAAALAVRAVYLHESSANPTFYSLTLDSRDYYLRAVGLAQNGVIDTNFFWQPTFYPFWLGVLFKLTGPSILVAKILQIVLGAITCVLTYRLGCRIFDRRIGLLAGAIVAFYGPLIFYEGEIDTAGWAAFWSVALLILLLQTAAKGSGAWCVVLGICGGLGILTRPTFLPVMLTALIWLAAVFIRDRRTWTETIGRLARVMVGLLLVLAPAASECYRAAGHFGVLPTSGGLNVYLGNNEDTCKTLTIRPGFEWEELTLLPERHGCKTRQEASQFFYGKAWQYAKAEPFSFASGLGHKALQMANGREIPRNVDIYLFREWSRLLGLLVWKAGRFGFPWGVLFPLAVWGLVWGWRRIPLPLVLFVVLYLLGIVVVFVADRYRVPVVPAMSILAAAGCMSIIDMLRGRQWRALATACCVAAAVGIISNLSKPACEEKVNYASEMYALLAQNAEEAGQTGQARELNEKALELD
ncbi:MAG TPA: glycosyltransferase family 39 protein, partial [Phycisphaerae bacterium]|nr:glycosyltransferase family 39 protein [Phycisphaerae bacterium]